MSNNAPLTANIRLRILTVALLPLVLAVGLFAIYFVQHSVAEAQQRVETQGQNSANYLAHASAFDLSSGNLAAVQRLLDAERRFNRLEVAGISDGNKWLLVSGNPKILPVLHANAPLGREHNPLYFSQAILLPASNVAGRQLDLIVCLSRAPIDAALYSSGLATVRMALVIILLALMLTWWWSKPISQTLIDQKLAQSRFLAALGHDLRQPLYALTLLVAALREQVAEGEAVRLVQQIEASAEAMNKLFNTLFDGARKNSEVAPAAGGFALPLEQALVAFIDDDETILAAMVAVFDHWKIALAVGVDALQVRADLHALGRAPDVILCDYRLREGRSGVEAVQILRDAFGAHIPAAIITGGLAAEAMHSIQSSHLPVLHKPLKPAKLRAFLSHLLAESSAADSSTHRSNS